MTKLLPFTLDVSAIAAGSLLIFAEDSTQAVEICQERAEELIAYLADGAHLPRPVPHVNSDPDEPYLTADRTLEYTFTVLPAMGYEVAGSEALTPGLFRIDTTPSYEPTDTED